MLARPHENVKNKQDDIGLEQKLPMSFKKFKNNLYIFLRKFTWRCTWHPVIAKRYELLSLADIFYIERSKDVTKKVAKFSSQTISKWKIEHVLHEKQRG